ncbi:hypothetical protein [Streptomonospora litoralis]|uniref:Uncharacterized protein n=1 Tax=Streptomonospora litoralis TaxID=2498135 RepID=A0A4P6Q026_9ACTN|nr:hypothetical protein [Streptomonospora litoralis]QBI53400.1 hypothetical protein EKD16_08030 [Streptomonospora litoralis]
MAAWVALAGAVLAGGCAPAPTQTVEPTPTPISSPSPASTREHVETMMAGDEWYESLPSEGRKSMHEEAQELCEVADEELTYGAVEGGSQELNYTRTLVIQIGLSGGIAGAFHDRGDATESATTFILAYVTAGCPEHEVAIEQIIDEQHDVIFGTSLNE